MRTRERKELEENIKRVRIDTSLGKWGMAEEVNGDKWKKEK